MVHGVCARNDVRRENARLAGQLKFRPDLPKINFILRQSDEDLACIAIHDSRTILKLYLDETDLARTGVEIDNALGHLRQSRQLNELVARNRKKSRFPRSKKKT